MSFYDVNYPDRDKELTPPNKRLPKFLAWLNCLNYPLQWLHDLIFNDYKTGASYPAYNPLAFYNTGDRVIGINKSVYECQVNGLNFGTAGPYNDPNWVKLQDVFIGTDERVLYSSQIIVFEYALNHYFLIPPANPQIYIANNSANATVFLIGDSGLTSSYIPDSSIIQQGFLWDLPSFASTTSNFTIFVPNAVLATLGSTLADQKRVVIQFANKYKLAGTTYTVQGY